jgi:ribosomal RNA-processing protein 1
MLQSLLPLMRPPATEKKLRDGAVRSLAAFLSQRAAAEPISREDMAKLWKGIFYCEQRRQ